MDSSSTLELKRSAKLFAEPRAKRRCDRAQSLSPIRDLFEAVHLCGESPYENFKCLSDSDQKVYFERSFTTLRSFPRIDLMVLQHYDKGDRLNQDELKATNMLQKKMKSKWKWVKPDLKESGRRQQREVVKWDDDKLWWNPSTQDFELRNAQVSNERHLLEHFENSLRQCGFLYHISSSLLLYRLTLLMGDSKPISTDGYKYYWEVRFYIQMVLLSYDSGIVKEGREHHFMGQSSRRMMPWNLSISWQHTNFPILMMERYR